LNNEKTEQLKRRTKQFGLRTIRLVQALPNGKVADVVGRQLLRAATSVGANYRSALRGRSTAEFLSRLGVVEEEIDESLYWMEMLVEAGLIGQQRLTALMKEANEIASIIVAAIKTTRSRHRRAEAASGSARRGAVNPDSGIRNPK
jgi:four helix bundle protein